MFNDSILIKDTKIEGILNVSKPNYGILNNTTKNKDILNICMLNNGVLKATVDDHTKI